MISIVMGGRVLVQYFSEPKPRRPFPQEAVKLFFIDTPKISHPPTFYHNMPNADSLVQTQPDKKPTGPPEIPVEVFEYIIAYIVDMKDDGDGTLINCARVCRTWYTFTLQHNFRYLFIKPRECHRFCELIGANPMIAQVTREIMFAEHSLDDKHPNIVPWVNDALKMLKGRLPNVEAMVFIGIHETGEISSLDLFANLAKYTGVKRLEMIGCIAPLPLIFAYICAFPNLETLNLKGIIDVPHKPNMFELKLDYPKPALKALRIKYVPFHTRALLEWIAGTPSKDTLEWATLAVAGWSPDVAEGFLRKLGPALIYLDIKICEGTGREGEEEEEYTSVNLQDCEHLKTLTLRTAICEGTPNMLADLRSEALQYLRFSVPPYEDSHEEHYQTLAIILAEMRFPPSFKGVHFICKGEYEKMDIEREKLGSIFHKFTQRYPISFIYMDDVERFWFTK